VISKLRPNRFLLAATFSGLLLTSVLAVAITQPARADQLVRTFRVAPPGVDPNGPSGEPSISGDSRYIAFASEASNFGPRVGTGRTSNVYVYDSSARSVSLISATPSGAGPDGPSSEPGISANGQVVTFVSSATNLVTGTPGRVGRIYVRSRSAPVRLVSVAFGGQPDADCSQPVISSDGRYIAFSSGADNFVAGDDNAASDIFLADLSAGTIRRVSVSSRGAQANGASVNPSISADGRYVSFTSTASNLVRGDHNHAADVFVHDTLTGQTRLVSASARGREQNASVAAPFTQVSSLSGDAHYIVFDSDATNLVHGDRNGHTDVFRHSLISGSTTLVSRSSLGLHGNNDSFSPSLSANGRVTVFESFADNLASPWAPNENVFAQDLITATTLTADVTPQGTPRGPELDAQLLQRPAVSADGQLMAFTSGANNLVAGDNNGTDDLFMRVLVPPTTSVVQAPPPSTTDRRPQVEFTGSLPLIRSGLCELDGRRRSCPMGRPFRLPRLGAGAHVLQAFAGAPGTLTDPHGVTVRFIES
jgi:Tol biopolymer transport system component